MQSLFRKIVILFFFMLVIRSTERADNVRSAIAQIVKRCATDVSDCGSKLKQPNIGEQVNLPRAQEATKMVRDLGISEYALAADSFEDPLEQMQTVVSLFPIRVSDLAKTKVIKSSSSESCRENIRGQYVDLCTR